MANPAARSVLHETVRSILAQETARSQDPARVALGVERALRGLQVAFSNVIGPAGFEGVLRRAIHLARPQHPWLQRTDVVVLPEVTLAELTATAEREGPEQVEAGAELIMVTFVSLLATFIGEELTLSVLRGRWSRPVATGAGAERGPTS